LNHFEDRDAGGFFFTAADHETLIHRSKTFSDEAVPAGNGVAAQALARLGWLIGDTRYLESAARTVRAADAMLQRYPQAHSALLVALDEQVEPPEIVIVRGEASEVTAWRDSLSRVYAPRRLVFAIADDSDLPTALAAKVPQETTCAYLCRGMTCSEPVRSLQALIALSGQ
jgi:uncharacterized protein YyaL (SSP411 family)